MKHSPNKRRFVPAVLLCVLAAVIVCGTVYAYMFHRTGEEGTTFTPATVSCKVVETFKKDNTKSSIKVENTGNVDAYLRVRLVTYWVNSEGNVAAKSSSSTVLADITPANGWIRGKDNTFYYPEPVAPDDVTPELLASGTTITLAQEGEFKQVVDVFAEAIQAEPTTAVVNSWGVTLASDGKTIAQAN